MQPLQARRLTTALRFLCWYELPSGDAATAAWRVLRHVAEIVSVPVASGILARPLGDAGKLLLEYSAESLATMTDTEIRAALRELTVAVATTKAAVGEGADPFELTKAMQTGPIDRPIYLPTALVPEGSGEPIDLSQEAKDGAATPTATGAEVFVPQIGSGVIQWDMLLAELLDTAKVSESWMRRPKRTLYRRDVVLPARTIHRRRTALVAIDISGSIDREGVQLFCETVRNTPATYDLTVATFATVATVWVDFRDGGALKMGGGTDFEAVERLCKAQRRYPDAVVVITDGQGAAIAPEHPNRWTWVLYGAGTTVRRRELFGMRAVELRA